jgi:hypothetical protein
MSVTSAGGFVVGGTSAVAMGHGMSVTSAGGFVVGGTSVVVSVFAPVFTDSFNGTGALDTSLWSADSTAVSPVRASGFAVSADNAATFNCSVFNTSLTNNQFAQVDIAWNGANDGVFQGVIVRGDTSGNGYGGMWFRNGATSTMMLYKIAALVPGVAIATLTIPSNTTKIRLNALGTTITMDYYNGSWVNGNLTITDSTFASGHAGLLCCAYIVDTMDNFLCGNL